MTVVGDPEVGRSVRTGGILTNVLDVGTGPPLLLLHGSGPGVSAWANWRSTMPAFSSRFRVVAPDLAGFGFTQVPADTRYGRSLWLRQVLDLLDALGIERTSVVGNSFGGGLALALAIEHPERVDRLVLMGSVGVPFQLTAGLDEVWGYQPSMEAMARLMRETFAYDPGFVTDDLVRMRFEASARPSTAAAFSSMFPAPRQRWVDALACDEHAVRAISNPTLLVHGRDDRVVPLSTTLTLLDWIDDSRAHVFGRCGHWTQIERAAEFTALVTSFVGGSADQPAR